MTVQQESSESRNPGRRYQEYTRNAPGIYQECTKDIPGMYQECTRNPGRKVPGMYQESWYRTRNIPGIHQESWYGTRTTRNPPGICGAVESSESRAAYICIDKACTVLRHIVTNNAYQDWFQTTRFVVDSYHYINHKATDNICRTWCNPAPTDGSAPNLVIPTTDKHGQPCFKCAFNTQACEQLNTWLGGYESILKCMTPGNFNWFLHTMLYYYTKHVLKKQELRRRTQDDTSDNNQDSDSD